MLEHDTTQKTNKAIKKIHLPLLLTFLLVLMIWKVQTKTSTTSPFTSLQNVETKEVPPLTPSSTPDPTSLYIPTLNISAHFTSLGLAKDGTIQTPQKPEEVGWYIHRAKPGDPGPTVIVGHKDSMRGPAVFARLNKIQVGDQVIITRADNSKVTYKVDSITRVEQDNFPTEDVYGTTPTPTLRLITCSGSYLKNEQHYSHNLVVYGSLVN